MTAEALQFAPGGGIPDACSRIVGDRHDQAAIGREARRIDRGRVTAQDLQLASRRDLPDTSREIIR